MSFSKKTATYERTKLPEIEFTTPPVVANEILIFVFAKVWKLVDAPVPATTTVGLPFDPQKKKTAFGVMVEVFHTPEMFHFAPFTVRVPEIEPVLSSAFEITSVALSALLV